MKYRLLFPSLLVLLAGTGRADETDKARLREAARLPLVSAFGGVQFSPTHGFSLPGEKRDVPAEIAAVLKEMKGDSQDAKRHLQLSELYELAGDPKRGEEAAGKAVNLFRQQLKDAPGNGPTLALLGESLAASGKLDEAEKTLREAVKVSPRDWHTWTALSQFLNKKAIRVLLDPLKDQKVKIRRDSLLTLALNRKIAGAQAAEAEKAFDEARTSMDRAVESWPAARNGNPMRTAPWAGFCRPRSCQRCTGPGPKGLPRSRYRFPPRPLPIFGKRQSSKRWTRGQSAWPSLPTVCCASTRARHRRPGPEATPTGKDCRRKHAREPARR